MGCPQPCRARAGHVAVGLHSRAALGRSVDIHAWERRDVCSGVGCAGGHSSAFQAPGSLREWHRRAGVRRSLGRDSSGIEVALPAGASGIAVRGSVRVDWCCSAVLGSLVQHCARILFRLCVLPLLLRYGMLGHAGVVSACGSPGIAGVKKACPDQQQTVEHRTRQSDCVASGAALSQSTFMSRKVAAACFALSLHLCVCVGVCGCAGV
mmetsp:Transcript_48631/g.128631  ORF Transcript_48631/g.128631 Transcript_48631/m.128631 type:complete len:209 (-) Transcript_48631:14-640(-)